MLIKRRVYGFKQKFNLQVIVYRMPYYSEMDFMVFFVLNNIDINAK